MTNIPLSQLRERLDEIPKDRTVYLQCRSGQRSYNAVLSLKQLGFTNVDNIAGSFLGISYMSISMIKLKIESL